MSKFAIESAPVASTIEVAQTIREEGWGRVKIGAASSLLALLMWKLGVHEQGAEQVIDYTLAAGNAAFASGSVATGMYQMARGKKIGGSTETSKLTRGIGKSDQAEWFLIGTLGEIISRQVFHQPSPGPAAIAGFAGVLFSLPSPSKILVGAYDLVKRKTK